MKYKATINVLGRNHTSEGKTAHEAISNLKVPLARGRSIVTMEKGDVKVEKILGLHLTARLFSPSPTVREIALKNAEILFGGL